MKTHLKIWIRRARRALKNVAPYTPLFLLPGGSLIVLAIWWADRQRTLVTVRT
jgi:hypothetical protein